MSSPAAACSCQITQEKDSRENYEQTFGKLFPGTFCTSKTQTLTNKFVSGFGPARTLSALQCTGKSPKSICLAYGSV